MPKRRKIIAIAVVGTVVGGVLLVSTGISNAATCAPNLPDQEVRAESTSALEVQASRRIPGRQTQSRRMLVNITLAPSNPLTGQTCNYVGDIVDAETGEKLGTQPVTAPAEVDGGLIDLGLPPGLVIGQTQERPVVDADGIDLAPVAEPAQAACSNQGVTGGQGTKGEGRSGVAQAGPGTKGEGLCGVAEAGAGTKGDGRPEAPVNADGDEPVVDEPAVEDPQPENGTKGAGRESTAEGGPGTKGEGRSGVAEAGACTKGDRSGQGGGAPAQQPAVEPPAVEEPAAEEPAAEEPAAEEPAAEEPAVPGAGGPGTKGAGNEREAEPADNSRGGKGNRNEDAQGQDQDAVVDNGEQTGQVGQPEVASEDKNGQRNGGKANGGNKDDGNKDAGGENNQADEQNGGQVDDGQADSGKGDKNKNGEPDEDAEVVQAGADASPPADASGSLPVTGASLTVMVTLAVILLGVGLATFVITRRRRVKFVS